MTGKVTLLHALLNVPFLLSGDALIEVPFVIDTGFTGALTLPSPDVETLQLVSLGTKRVTLADDSAVEVPLYRATILWNGIEKRVAVLATGGRPLLGTALLDGTELNIRFIENGEVTLEAL